MKIVFISRSTLFSVKGGDTVQMVNTAQALRNLGVEVDIALSNETIDYAAYDLLHFFNIIRPDGILHHIHKSQKPFVISPVYVDYSEYEKKHTSGVRHILSRLFSKNGMEYIKTLARWVVNGESVVSVSYLFKGHAASIRSILKKTAWVLPNSVSELTRLQREYGTKLQARIVPNAIDIYLFTPHTHIRKEAKLVICAARIEGNKNQLELIHALNNTEYTLIIIGNPAPNHKEYYHQCRNEASANVSFVGEISQEQLVSYYSRAKVHAMPSWFETTGLSSLEAAYCGCNVVMGNRGDQYDYFGDAAWYCDPGSEESIRQAVFQAAQAPYNESFREKIAREFTWEQTAKETGQVYKEILKCI